MYFVMRFGLGVDFAFLLDNFLVLGVFLDVGRRNKSKSKQNKILSYVPLIFSTFIHLSYTGKAVTVYDISLT